MKKWVVLISVLIGIPLALYSQNFSNKKELTGLAQQKDARRIGTGMLYTVLEKQRSNDSVSEQTGFLSWLTQKPVLYSSSDDHWLTLNPVFNLQLWKSEKNSGYINSRGAEIHGNFHNRIFFHTSFYENQGRFQDYLNDYAEKYGVLPGYARMKPYNDNAWDYTSAFGSVQLNASEQLKFRLGHDKLFIGEGHRSLFLSDAAFQQLFFQTSIDLGQFRFTNITLQWINPNFNNLMQWETEQSTEGNYQRKTNSINMLEWQISDAFRLGFVEAVVFKPETGFNLNMVNPWLFFRASMIRQNSGNNILMGLDALYAFDNTDVYAQLMIDDVQATNLGISNPCNRFGWQIGAMYYDVFGVQNLHVRTEHNYIRAMSYAESMPEISWTHYNQNAAHPAGNNLVEFIAMVQYRWRNLPLSCQLNYMEYGDEHNESVVPADFNFPGGFVAGDTKRFVFADVEAGYIINPVWHWIAYAGVSYRHDGSDEALWVRIGTRTNIHRLIRDF
ncbi:MAG: hypothetical protein PF590_00480 [Candidatus Delongbacteria bacterium]|nr:hypothetical protein [Candidatus Delongbacteria bacterium]